MGIKLAPAISQSWKTIDIVFEVISFKTNKWSTEGLRVQLIIMPAFSVGSNFHQNTPHPIHTFIYLAKYDYRKLFEKVK